MSNCVVLIRTRELRKGPGTGYRLWSSNLGQCRLTDFSPVLSKLIKNVNSGHKELILIMKTQGELRYSFFESSFTVKGRYFTRPFIVSIFRLS